MFFPGDCSKQNVFDDGQEEPGENIEEGDIIPSSDDNSSTGNRKRKRYDTVDETSMYMPMSPVVDKPSDDEDGDDSDDEPGYESIQPPRKKREAEWISSINDKDNFKPPLDQSTAQPERSCIICKYCVLGSGEIGNTIVQIYEENVGRYTLSRVYEIILDFWADFFANQDIKVYKIGQRSNQDIRGSRDPVMIVEPSPSPPSRTNPAMCLDKYLQKTSSSAEEDSVTSTPPSDLEIASGNSSSEGTLAESPPRVIHPEPLPPCPYYIETVPHVTLSDIHHHFTDCYREHNGYNIIFDQLNKMLDMQNIVYENSVYQRRKKQKEQAGQVDISGARTMAREALNQLEDIIQTDVTHVDGMLKKLGGSTISGGGITMARRRNTTDIKTSVKERETKLRKNMKQFKSLKEKVNKLYEVDTSDRKDRRDICINMKEATLIQSLGRSIISLNREVSSYRSKRGGTVPLAQSSREYYATLPFINKQQTGNDTAVVERRKNATIMGAYSTEAPTSSFRQAFPTEDTPSFGEYIPGGTGRRASDNAKKTLKKRSRFEMG